MSCQCLFPINPSTFVMSQYEISPLNKIMTALMHVFKLVVLEFCLSLKYQINNYRHITQGGHACTNAMTHLDKNIICTLGICLINFLHSTEDNLSSEMIYRELYFYLLMTISPCCMYWYVMMAALYQECVVLVALFPCIRFVGCTCTLLVVWCGAWYKPHIVPYISNIRLI